MIGNNIIKWIFISAGSIFVGIKLLRLLKIMKRNKRSPPFASNWMPFLGHFLSLNKNPIEFVMKESRDGMIPITVDLAGKDIVILPGSYFKSYFKQDDKAFLFNEGQKKFAKMDLLFPVTFGIPYHENGFFSPAAVIIKKDFNPYLRHFVPHVVKRASKYFQRVIGEELTENVYFSDNVTLDQARKDIFYRVVAEASTQTLVNNENVLESEELMTMLLDYSIVMQDAFRKAFITSSDEAMKVELNAIQYRRDIFKKHILPVLRERRESVEKYEGVNRSKSVNTTGLMDFLQFMLEDERTSKMSEEIILGMLESIVFAAYMTTTAALKNFLMDVATRKELLKSLEDERKVALGCDRFKISAAEAEITIDDIKKMPLLDSALRESFRMRPTAMGPATRVAFEDVEVADANNENPYLIEKDTMVMLNHFSVHSNDEIYENPKEFEPKRFMATTSAEITDNIENFHIFGGGRHMCPGRFFALAEIKSIVTALLMDYDMECDTISPYKFALTRPYRDAIPIKFIKKTHLR